MSKISAVIFDMDGLMFDTEPLFFEANSSLVERRGKTYSLDFYKTQIGKLGLQTMQELKEELGLTEDPETLLEERKTIFNELLRTRATMMPGLVALLDHLEAHNIRRAIGTSSIQERVDTLLNRFSIAHRFEHIVTGDQVQNGKPHPEIYLTALERLSLPGSLCLVLEDGVHGVHAGKAAGCIVGAVPNELTKDGDFSAADHIFTSLEDPALLSLLKMQ